MAKQPETDLVPTDLVTVTMDMDKDDVAAILMSRAEERIKLAIKACQDREKVLTKEHDELREAFNDLCEEFAKEKMEDTVETLTEAATALKCKNISTEVYSGGFTLHNNMVAASMSLNAQKPRVRWEVSTSFKATAALKKAYQTGEKKRKEIDDNKKQWIEWRRKLADLPSMERRAKAAVAESRLKSTKEGQKLVDMLNGDLDNSVKLLGIC